MRKQDQLIALINSLTQGERKYFKQRNRTGTGDKSYLKLYELLSGASIYNPEEITRQLGKSKAGLANEKKYLEKTILSALREYHDSHPQIGILNRIAEGILLMEKNLPRQAVTSAKQAVNMATSSDNWPLAWQANSLLLTLCSDPFASFADAALESKHRLFQMQQIAERLKLITDFELFSEEVYKAYATRSTDATEAQRKETGKLLNHPLLQNDYNNFQLLSYKYSLQSLLLARMGNYLQNVDINRKLLSLYEAQPVIDKMGYWNAIANLTQSLILAGNFDEYSAWMAKLNTRYYHKLPLDSLYIDNMLKPYKSIFESGAYFRFISNGMVSTDAVRLYTKRIIRMYSVEQKNVTPFHFVSLVYKTAACSLLIGDVDDSIRLLQRLFNEEPDYVNLMATKNARLLFLIIQAQLGNKVLFNSLAQSFALFGKKNGNVSSAEKLFVKQLSQLASLQTKRERLNWFRTLNESLLSDKVNTDTKQLLEAVPIRKWVAGCL